MALMQQQELPYDLFRQAFYQYYEPLCQYAFTFIKEEHACEDIVQETFLRIWEKRSDLIGTDAIRFYLFTAVRNNCLTWIEKNKKRAITPFTGNEQVTTNIETKEQQPEQDFDVMISEALERLPPKCREVFVMSRMSKLSYQQIADSLEISIKTVENHMGKALKLIRDFVKEKRLHLILATYFFHLMHF